MFFLLQFLCQKRSAKIQLLRSASYYKLMRSAWAFTTFTFLMILKMHFKLYREARLSTNNHQICLQKFRNVFSHEIILLKENL